MVVKKLATAIITFSRTKYLTSEIWQVPEVRRLKEYPSDDDLCKSQRALRLNVLTYLQSCQLNRSLNRSSQDGQSLMRFVIKLLPPEIPLVVLELISIAELINSSPKSYVLENLLYLQFLQFTPMVKIFYSYLAYSVGAISILIKYLSDIFRN